MILVSEISKANMTATITVNVRHHEAKWIGRMYSPAHWSAECRENGLIATGWTADNAVKNLKAKM